MITTLYCLSERQPLHRLCSFYVDGDVCICAPLLTCEFFSQLFSLVLLFFIRVKNFEYVSVCVHVLAMRGFIKIYCYYSTALVCSFICFTSFGCRIKSKNVSCELFKRIRKFLLLLCNCRMLCWGKRLKQTVDSRWEDEKTGERDSWSTIFYRKNLRSFTHTYGAVSIVLFWNVWPCHIKHFRQSFGIRQFLSFVNFQHTRSEKFREKTWYAAE